MGAQEIRDLIANRIKELDKILEDMTPESAYEFIVERTEKRVLTDLLEECY